MENYRDESVKGFDQGRSQVLYGDKAGSLLFGLWADDIHLRMDGFWMRRGGGSPAGRGSFSKQGDLVERDRREENASH